MTEKDTMLRLPRLRGASMLGALLVWTALLTGTASTAHAAGDVTTANTAGPVITSHVDGQQVSREIEVTVTSVEPVVRIAWAADEELEFPTQTVDGEGRKVLSTSGHHGLTTIVARECSSDQVCEGPATTVQVDVSNAPPTFEDAGVWVSEWHGEDIMYALTYEGWWAWYATLLDGEYVPYSSHLPFVFASASELGDGQHTVQVVRCTEPPDETPIVEPPVCDMAHRSELRSFRVRTALHLTISDVRSRVISPDGNGVHDAAEVTVTADTGQVTSWELLRGSATVSSGVAVERSPGAYAITVDGLDAAGAALPSGTYELKVHAFSLPSEDPRVDSRMITGQTSTTITVDNDAPSVTNISAGPSPFYPRRDGYRDSVNIRGTVSEQTSSLRIRVFLGGEVVRRFWATPTSDGRFARSWDGRMPRSGWRLPPGSYRYDFVATDMAGNRARTPGGRIQLLTGR